MVENNQDDDLELNPTKKPSIDEVVSILQKGENEHVPAAAYYGLSDLDDASLHIFEPVWQELRAEYKRKDCNRVSRGKRSQL